MMQGGSLFKLALLVVVVSLAVVFLLPYTCGPTRAETVTTENVAILKLHDAVERENAARKKVERAYHAKGVSLRHDADTASTPQAKLLFMAQSCDAFRDASLACQERAELLQIRMDTLERALGRQISVTGCKILLVATCPTRMQTAGAFLLVGGVLGFLLGKP